MSGRHKWSELRERVVSDPESRRRVEELGRAYDALLDLAELAELRKSRGITQAELAERLGVSQPNIAKIEAAARDTERHDEGDAPVAASGDSPQGALPDDDEGDAPVPAPRTGKSAASRSLPGLHLSTLASYVEALGGRLELRATFPEHHETDVTVPIGTHVEAPDEVAVAAGVEASDEARDG